MRRILTVLATITLVAVGLATSTQVAFGASYNESRGPNYTSRVILTFDDCPRTLTSFKKVLQYAKKKNDGLVLAPTGDCLQKFRNKHGVDLAKLARSYGQYVINHSINHRKDMRSLSCNAVARELRSPGVVTNFGRPPYGRINSSVRCGYAKAGMKPWLWTGATGDTTGKSKAKVVSAAVKVAKPGATILMHMQWNGFGPDAIRKIKLKLEDKGLKVCRAYRGKDNKGAIVTSPAKLPAKLPC
ncbi:polysaccharide deacetylase family protein [Arthrobacter sp. I2-34]|uniref:Polysaccharide deacetylase family protein n=1 Tax=Arthrobacter hankyongi TaxID=2904801 RepID=A0ABS9L712_9MICC|nr:polysaccharide deacetylase family protein [Arthrobacter hankyongi]MCG2622282.1 polysaccharide deacetylase family protein [Arthrobacter hankyongi]